MPLLNPEQLAKFSIATRLAAANCSRVFSKWAKQKVDIRMDAVESVTYSEVVPHLGPIDPVCFGLRQILSGDVRGTLLFLLREQAGFSLIDSLMNRPPSSTKSLGEMERSALLETGNIVGTAYCNAMVQTLGAAQIHPGPPALVHDLTASIVQSALLDTTTPSDQEALFAQLEFTSLDLILEWKLVFFPDYRTLRAFL